MVCESTYNHLIIVGVFSGRVKDALFILKEAANPVLVLQRLQASHDQENAQQRESKVLESWSVQVFKALQLYSIDWQESWLWKIFENSSRNQAADKTNEDR